MKEGALTMYSLKRCVSILAGEVRDFEDLMDTRSGVNDSVVIAKLEDILSNPTKYKADASSDLNDRSCSFLEWFGRLSIKDEDAWNPEYFPAINGEYKDWDWQNFRFLGSNLDKIQVQTSVAKLTSQVIPGTNITISNFSIEPESADYKISFVLSVTDEYGEVISIPSSTEDFFDVTEGSENWNYGVVSYLEGSYRNYILEEYLRNKAYIDEYDHSSRPIESIMSKREWVEVMRWVRKNIMYYTLGISANDD